MVYTEGGGSTGDGDFVPACLAGVCVHKDLCQCDVVGLRHQGWHHVGALCSNVVSRRHQFFERKFGCSQVKFPFLSGCNANIRNIVVAIEFFRVVMHILIDVPPSLPQRGAPLASVFVSRELKPKW